jgi:hypothetical protein
VRGLHALAHGLQDSRACVPLLQHKLKLLWQQRSLQRGTTVACLSACMLLGI